MGSCREGVMVVVGGDVVEREESYNRDVYAYSECVCTVGAVVGWAAMVEVVWAVVVEKSLMVVDSCGGEGRKV